MSANVIKKLILPFISAMMKRLFAAIKIHPDKNFLDQLYKLKKQLVHEKIKWVEDHNIHVTLKFFGETEVKKMPDIESVLHRIAISHSPFAIRLVNLGFFGSRYDPKIVWVGIEPYDRLVNLMRDLRAELKTIGYEPDRQNLVPHLTIGRIKQLKDKQLFLDTIEKFKEIYSSEMIVTEFFLYESILKKEGPVYTVQMIFPFASLRSQ
jgi:RNA 2',3'-cyclic 3'-phosphodiesterase